MSTIAEMRENAAKKVADARAVLEQITDDTDESRAKELEGQYDAFMAEYDKLEERIQRQEKLEEAEGRMSEPDPRRPKGEDTTVDPENRGEQVTQDDAFRAYLRYGNEGLETEEREALKPLRDKGDGERRAQSTSNTAGGYTIPQGFMPELVKTLQMWGPMLNPGVTREIVTSMGNQIDWPTMDDTSNKGALLAENTQDSEQDITFGQKQLDAYKYTSKIIRVSEELLQDSALDVANIVIESMGERLGRIVNEHLTTGDGSGKPNGIVTASTSGTTAAANNAVTFEELLDLIHSVDPMYRMDPSVRFMFHDSTLRALRKVKDNDGRFIWQPADARTGEPASLYGYQYAINQDMPEIGSLNKSILFGVMNRYVVRRVREFQTKRLMERYADYYQVGFLGFGRFDGELVDTAAVKHLAHPT